MKDRGWVYQFITHPVLGTWIVLPNLLCVNIVLIAVIAGTNPGAKWIQMMGIFVPFFSVSITGLLAILRPAPVWRNGHWEKR